MTDYLAPEKLAITELEWLRHYFYLSNPDKEESLLRVALVNETDQIKRLMGGNAAENYELSRGYKAITTVKNKET